MPTNALFFDPPIEQNYIGHIMSEVYKDQVYAPFLTGKRDLVILDIGANIGITSYYFSQFAKQVISVEPSKEHFSNLTKMIEYNQIKNIVAVNKALHLENSTATFYHNQNKTMYSLHQAVGDPSLPTEEVQTITLDKLLEDNKVDQVDLMKLDVEGSEVEILSSDTFSKVSDKIKLIIGESHSWSGRNPKQLEDTLKMNGFSFETLPTEASIFIAKKP